MAKHNRAAFSRADVEDAKRGHPDFDLRGYAAHRGLEFSSMALPRAIAPPCRAGRNSNPTCCGDFRPGAITGSSPMRDSRSDTPARTSTPRCAPVHSPVHDS
jgi:hypothetical protein